MTTIDFARYPFAERPPGATDDDLLVLSDELTRPFTAEELEGALGHQRNPFPPTSEHHAGWEPLDGANWAPPGDALPPDYLALLKFSNGCYFQAEEMEVSFYAIDEIRELMLDYALPESQPGVVPIGSDGGGRSLKIDLRAAASGVWSYWLVGDGCPELEDGFMVGHTIAEVLDSFVAGDPTDVSTDHPEYVDVYLEVAPRAGLAAMLDVKRALALQATPAQLKAWFVSTPTKILANQVYGSAMVRCRRLNEQHQCLGLRSVLDPSEKIAF